MPQLIVGSHSKDEQNVAISLKLTTHNPDGSSIFAAKVSSQRLSRTLYVIPSLKDCSAEKIETRVTRSTTVRTAKSLVAAMLANPRLILDSVRKQNLGYRFQRWPDRINPGTKVRSVIELASRNFPNPDELRFGADPYYTYWINCKYETLIPRRMIERDKSPFPVAVAVTTNLDQMDQFMPITLSSLTSAGISREMIFLLEANSDSKPSRGKGISEENPLRRLFELPPDTFLLHLKAGDTVSRDFLHVCKTHVPLSTNFVYFDHDHAAADGTFFDYEFKPDCSPNTLFFRNYPSRASMVRLSLLHDLVKRLPTLETTNIESIVYASAIEAMQQINSQSALHIPIPSVHLKKNSSEETSRTSKNEEKVRNLQLGVYAPNFIIMPNDSHGAQWNSKIPPKASVSILIPTKDRIDLIKPAIDSIRTLTEYPNYEIIVIDNQSVEAATINYVKKLADEGLATIKTFDQEFNFARMHNQIIPQLSSDYVLLLNNDTEVLDRFWLTRLIELFDLPNIGIVGNKLRYPDGTIQHAGATGGLRGPMAHHLVGKVEEKGDFLLSFPRDVLAVTGACLLVPRQLYLESGGMDEKLAISYNDMDLCLSVRVNMGKAVIVSSSGGVTHKESKSRGSSFSHEHQRLLNSEAQYFDDKWLSHIRPDPFYNPNLSLDQDFTLR